MAPYLVRSPLPAMETFLALFIVALIFAVILYPNRVQDIGTRDGFPEPLGYPLIGTAPRVLMNCRNMIQYMDHLWTPLDTHYPCMGTHHDHQPCAMADPHKEE